MRRGLLTAALAAGLGFATLGSAQAVEIQYWQYLYPSRVKAMDQLIENFEKANPDITVKQVTFPYANYQTRLVAAKAAGQGPDVLQLFYGWLDNFVGGQLIQPLPSEDFPAKEIESDFFPIVTAMKRDGKYYGLPTAVRSLALFYNKKLFKEAGLDPNKPPQTLDALVDAAKKTAKHDSSGNLTTEGMTIDMGGQDHQWWREVLVRQFGGQPYTDGDRKVAYDDQAGLKALQYYIDFDTKYHVGKPGFMDEAQAAFRGGKAAMTIDGTFRLGSFADIKSFDWAVTELPANADGTRSNYASYFANAIGSGVQGEKLEASKKFLKYVSSPEAMKIWLKVVGELPARKDVALTQENLNDPILSPFIKALKYAHTTMFVDEEAQRQVAIDMVNRILLENQDPKASLDQAAKAEQQIIDRQTGK
ncbi:extracellular solute-binding protein [Pararhizobium mangrovi]|uniref:Extracellular solute-binding protein n=1 Tax=Pararhizobium mangrovi TaxID=2590452 RepID=A0A506U2F7_9HYPH|nr:extracellular solute-binding protein [Pararhizobium mangrovi]TPW27175.1 extracellular solute-binding protein [Pararhizobium mangrovi]